MIRKASSECVSITETFLSLVEKDEDNKFCPFIEEVVDQCGNTSVAVPSKNTRKTTAPCKINTMKSLFSLAFLLCISTGKSR